MTALFKYILSSSKISFNCLLVAIVASLCSAKINLDILTNSIGAGTTLVGTTSDNLKELGYSIAVSGSIENYVNEHLKLMKCQIERGYVNVAFRTVSSGLREGFASHKAGNAATGSYLMCTYKIMGDEVRIMYSVPYSQDFYKNTLAVSACSMFNPSCNALTINDLYSSPPNSLFERREYYSVVRKTSVCGPSVCVSGTMGTSHKPTIHIKIFPRSYNKLTSSSKSTAVKNRWNPTDYERFILSN